MKPIGTPFNGTGLARGTLVDTGAPREVFPFLMSSEVPLQSVVTGLSGATAYHWRMRVLTTSPFFPRSRWFWLPGNAVTEYDLRTFPRTSVAIGGEHDTGLRIARVESNPVIESARIVFAVPRPGRVRMSVYDIAGRRVGLVLDRELAPGTHDASWDARDQEGRRLAPGVYLVRLEQGASVADLKLILGR